MFSSWWIGGINLWLSRKNIGAFGNIPLLSLIPLLSKSGEKGLLLLTHFRMPKIGLPLYIILNDVDRWKSRYLTLQLQNKTIIFNVENNLEHVCYFTNQILVGRELGGSVPDQRANRGGWTIAVQQASNDHWLMYWMGNEKNYKVMHVVKVMASDGERIRQFGHQRDQINMHG